jgi:hypothetical protein
MNERKQNREGQNQSAPQQGEGGRPGQDHDLAGMKGQQAERGGQQGQPEELGEGDGDHGGNR